MIILGVRSYNVPVVWAHLISIKQTIWKLQPHPVLTIACVCLPPFAQERFDQAENVSEFCAWRQASKNFAEDVAILILDLARLSTLGGGGGNLNITWCKYPKHSMYGLLFTYRT